MRQVTNKLNKYRVISFNKLLAKNKHLDIVETWLVFHDVTKIVAEAILSNS